MKLDARNPAELIESADIAVPTRLANLLDGADWPALLLVAGPGARKSGWAARAASRLATDWAARRAGVVLVDLSLESPELHDALGLPNDAGIADMFAFGASLERTARSVANSHLSFVPAGEYVPDPGAVLRHPRWNRLIESAGELAATLCLYVPAGADGLDALAARVGRAVVLATSGEADSVTGGLPAECVVMSVLSATLPEPPLPAESESGVAAEAGAEAESVAEDARGSDPSVDIDRGAISDTVEAWLASIGGVGATHGPEEAAAVATVAAEPEPVAEGEAGWGGDPLSEPPPVEPARRRSRGWLYVLLAGLSLAAAAAAAWYYFTYR